MCTLKSRYAFADFLELVEAEVHDLSFSHHERPWFRGCSDRSHGQLPSLFRAKTLERAYAGSRMPKPLSLENPDDVVRLESDLFFDFQTRLHRERVELRSAWDLLFLMRHYGFPTRTLDWTETLGVALHFAIQDCSDAASPTLWVLNPHELNGLTTSQRDTILPRYIGALSLAAPEVDYDVLLAEYQFDSTGLFASAAGRHDGPANRQNRCTSPLAICPEMSNLRMQAQSGTFTVHRDDWRAMELQVDQKCLRQIVLPKQAIEGARLFLKEAGLTTRVIFPGVDGLAAEMRARF